jgi:PAS domain-containing protein
MSHQDVALILARKLAETLADVVLMIDAQGDTIFFNEPAGRLLGRPFEEFDALPFDQRNAMLAPLRADGSPLPREELPGIRAMAERRPTYVAFHMHDVEGRLLAIETVGIPLQAADGRVLGAFVVAWLHPPVTSQPAVPHHEQP